MRTVKGNETTEAKEVAVEKKITVNECYILNSAIGNLSSTCPSMKGKVVFALQKNEAKVESVLKKMDKKRQAIVDKFIKLDKEGNPVLTTPSEEEIANGARQEYIYKKESDKEIAAKEVGELMNQEVDIEFHKIWMNDFEKLDIATARNPNIGIFIKYLVSEAYDLRD